jgi:hypothetical protein
MLANGFPLYQRRPGVGDGPTIQLPVNHNADLPGHGYWHAANLLPSPSSTSHRAAAT